MLDINENAILVFSKDFRVGQIYQLVVFTRQLYITESIKRLVFLLITFGCMHESKRQIRKTYDGVFESVECSA